MSSVASEAVDALSLCRHCGEACASDAALVTADGPFCCQGCETVFGILREYRLEGYYACDVPPGVTQQGAERRDRARFAALDDPAVAARVVEFDDGQIARVTLSIPSIHCASCVWLLERLWRLDAAVVRAEVDLLRRTVHVEYRSRETSLRRVAETLAAVGYEPVITEEKAPSVSPHRRLYLQLGVAGFALGNIMLFSIPRYVNGEPLDGGFQRLFDVLNVLFAIPVLLFSASDFFRGAWHAVRTRVMTLDVPLAIGLAVLFGRSVADIALGRGEGYLDSFVGLAFFLLIARLFQQKVFERIAFDRTFRSFLPLSVRVLRDGVWSVVPLEALRTGDRLAVRPHEVIPADAVLLEERGEVDYAFITGESTPVAVTRGDVVRAGGRVAGGTLELQTVRDVSHSQIARLWNNPVFGKPKARWLTAITARFAAWFTAGAIGLALAGAVAWWPDLSASVSVATAVLIIACPCAFTLSAPITLGTAMGVLGGRGLYLKHPSVALDLSRIDLVAFDKTGTLTTAAARQIAEWHGLSSGARVLVQRLAAESVHPASRAIAGGADAERRGDARQSTAGAGATNPAAHADVARPAFETSARVHGKPRGVQEIVGGGITGTVDGVRVAIGSADFVATQIGRVPPSPAGAIAVAAGDEVGWVRLSAAARDGVEAAARSLGGECDLQLLSGDHDCERSRWTRLFGSRMRFRQSPQDKLAYVSEARAAGRHVLMVGDGLNDAGALAAADVGIAVSDETACMTPACDAVLSGARLADLPAFLRYARRARSVVLLCFVVSIVYNIVGLTFALLGALTPLAAAILMPVSSLTIVGLSTGVMRWSARRMLPA